METLEGRMGMYWKQGLVGAGWREIFDANIGCESKPSWRTISEVCTCSLLMLT